MALNGKHLQYADLVGRGKVPFDAYQEVYGGTKSAAYKGSERLSKNVEVVSEIGKIRDSIRAELGADCADVAEVMRFLTGILRASPGLLPLDSPLVQEIRLTRPYTEKGKPLATNQEGLTQGELFEDCSLKIPDKLRAADMLLKVFGSYKVDQNAGKAGDALANLMASIAAGGGKNDTYIA